MKNKKPNFNKFAEELLVNDEINIENLHKVNLKEEEIANLPDDLFEFYISRLPKLPSEKQSLFGMKNRLKAEIKEFNNAAFSTYIIQKLYQENTFGRTKHQKLKYLIENHCELPIESNYIKYIAGPYDKDLEEYEKYAERENWFGVIPFEINENEETKYKNHYTYTIKDNVETGIKVAKGIIGDNKKEIDKIIELFRKLNTRQCEIIATVYDVWNDILCYKKELNDKAIVDGFYSFFKSKKEFTEEEILNGYKWLIKNNIIPKGKKRITKHN